MLVIHRKVIPSGVVFVLSFRNAERESVRHNTCNMGRRDTPDDSLAQQARLSLLVAEPKCCRSSLAVAHHGCANGRRPDEAEGDGDEEVRDGRLGPLAGQRR